MKKQILSVLTALVLLASLIPAAYAEPGDAPAVGFDTADEAIGSITDETDVAEAAEGIDEEIIFDPADEIMEVTDEPEGEIEGTAELSEKSGTCGDNLTWVLDDEGTLTISGSGAMHYWSYYSNVP